MKILEQKILKKALAIKKRSIIEDSIIEKVRGLNDVPIEKLNKLVKKIKLKKKDKQTDTQVESQQKFKFI